MMDLPYTARTERISLNHGRPIVALSASFHACSSLLHGARLTTRPEGSACRGWEPW